MHRLRREFRQLVVLLNEAITGYDRPSQPITGTWMALRRHSEGKHLRREDSLLVGLVETAAQFGKQFVGGDAR